MGSVIVLLLLAGVGFTALFLPWVGVAGAYLIGILNPQSIWWWSFEGLRPVYWVLLPTLMGVILMGIRGRLRWEALANVRMACIVVIWLSGMVSWWLGPYSISVAPDGEPAIRGAAFIMDNFSKIVILFIAALLCCDGAKHLKYMTALLLVTGLYLTWWINDRYLFQGAWGRVAGPMPINGDGTYSDENAFGSLFVIVFPFVWYAGFAAKRLWLRFGFWACVPFVWHGLFLTGSRGALLALGASLLVIAIRMKRKSFGVALVVLFAIAFAWQAGDTMKDRASSIDEYSEDQSATGRLDAWEAGAKMMLDNPITGVGPGAFLRAFPDYSEMIPRQAHNTVVQFGAEFGIFALLAFVVLFCSCIFSLWRINSSSYFKGSNTDTVPYYVIEATLAANVGCLVTGLFLSQQLFEIMYFLVFLTCMSINFNHSRGNVIENSGSSANVSTPHSSLGSVNFLPARFDQSNNRSDR
jgi:putative inorganic carbon (HCO3(-)) transporter